nr:hypothetical protein BaRGS_025172 [Batillaria attramentaria]
MLVLLAVVCLAGPLAASLPDVTVSHDGGLQFKMPDFPGAKEVFFNYMLNALDDKVLPKIGKAVKGGDGQWVWKDLSLALQHGDKILYNAVVKGLKGHQEGPVKTWPTIGPRRMRGVVIFRDDFNGGTLDRGHWDYEISMYGGMTNVCLPEIWGTCTQSANYGCHREGKYGILPPVMSGKIKSKPTLRYGTVEFYMIFNVAVGGTNGFFPEGVWNNKPWSNTGTTAPQDFYRHKNEWYSTWHGDDVAMMIDYVEFRAL